MNTVFFSLVWGEIFLYIISRVKWEWITNFFFHGKNYMGMSSLTLKPKEIFRRSTRCQQLLQRGTESLGWEVIWPTTQLQFVGLDCSCMHKLLAFKSVEPNYSHINNVCPISLYTEMGRDSGIRDYRSNQGPDAVCDSRLGHLRSDVFSWHSPFLGHFTRLINNAWNHIYKLANTKTASSEWLQPSGCVSTASSFEFMYL